MTVSADRLAAQLLSGPPATSPEAVVRRILAVQAQDPRGARLAVRSRSVGLTAADVDDALTNRRSLVVSWLNRGTLHLVTAEDYWLLAPLTTPRLAAGNARRLAQEGVSPRQADRGIAVVLETLADGPATRTALRARLDEAGVPTRGQALVHVLVAATLRGQLVRGPVVDGEQAFVRAADWLGDPPPGLGRAEALAQLARRYLAGHGPAAAADLAKWAGLPLTDARAGLAGIADEIVERPDGLVELVGGVPAHDLPGPRLLGPFDPLLHGWASRADVVGAHHGVVTTNGLFRPVALVEGRVVATWGLTGDRLTVRLLEPVDDAVVDALRTDAAAVLEYLGLLGGRPAARPAAFETA